MKRIQKLLALSLYQWKILVSAIILLPAIRISLNMSGFKMTYNKILNTNLSNQPQTNLSRKQLLEAQESSHAIDIAAFHGFHNANCLTKSLLLIWVLKKRDVPCQLMIGVHDRESIKINKFNAHAWVELDGIILNDRTETFKHFKPFFLPNGLLE